MKELIKIEDKTICAETVQTVDARNLHKFLKVETAFKDWIARRLDEYKFIENQDFLCRSNLSSKIGQDKIALLGEEK